MTNLIPLPDLQVVDGQSVVSSLTVAEHFDKRHANVLAAIGKIISECAPEFTELNFKLSYKINELASGTLYPRRDAEPDAPSVVVEVKEVDHE